MNARRCTSQKLLLTGIVLAMGLLSAACGGNGDSDSQSSTGAASPTAAQDEITPIVASSDIAVGSNRFLIGLIDDQDAPIRSPETTLRVGFLPPGSETIDTVTEMEFIWSVEPVQGLWVGTAEFSEPGEWRAVVQLQGGEYEGTVGATFTVSREPSSPPLGARPPAVDTPTAADAADLSDISTDERPVRRFYELSIADALKARRPAVIAFATPKFCASQVCGPTLSNRPLRSPSSKPATCRRPAP